VHRDGRMFEHIERCLDLQEQDIVEAIASGESTRALLTRLASLSAPNSGCAKVLLLFARMATTACAWIDGDLVIELVAKGDATVAEAATDLGGGLRERALPTATLKAPLAEFTRAIDRVPHMIAPLSIQSKSPKRIVLTATATTRRTSMPPAPVEIATDSLFIRVPTAAVPKEEEGEPSSPAALPVVTAPRRDAPAPRKVSDPPASDIDGGWED
jgi:hypothetical protein